MVFFQKTQKYQTYIQATQYQSFENEAMGIKWPNAWPGIGDPYGQKIWADGCPWQTFNTETNLPPTFIVYKRTQKHLRFVNGPIGEKPVTELPGIGPIHGQRLEAAGYSLATQVVGMYLCFCEDQAKFMAWLGSITFAYVRHVNQCYMACKDWIGQHPTFKGARRNLLMCNEF